MSEEVEDDVTFVSRYITPGSQCHGFSVPVIAPTMVMERHIAACTAKWFHPRQLLGRLSKGSSSVSKGLQLNGRSLGRVDDDDHTNTGRGGVEPERHVA